MEEAKKSLEPIMSLFSGNPFSTPVGIKIEQATDALNPTEDWALIMEIVDIINQSDEGPKDAVRAIRKRLGQNAGKNYSVIMYTLTVLETCVKNCGKRFHTLICNKDFVQDLVKLIGPKNDPPAVVQEKILGLIQTWADTFQTQPDLSGVVQVYHDLKSKGIEFPMTDLDSMAPILTPKRSVETEPILHQVDLGERQVKVSGDQVVKIRRDLDLVQGNMAVFAEMLSEMKPGNEDAKDLELIQELYNTCKEMQRRIADLLCTVSSDELTAELLHINDELNNLFLRYGRCRKNIEKTSGAPAAMSHKDDSEPSLIDWGEPKGDTAAVTSTAQKMTAALNLKDSSAIQKPSSRKVEEDSDFDMFAQSRTASYEKSKSSGSTYADNSNLEQASSLGAVTRKKGPGPEVEDEFIQMHRESDFDEMEAWLKANPGAVGGESLTSSEFDKFLQERANAASDTRPSPAGRSAMDKEKQENKMFAL